MRKKREMKVEVHIGPEFEERRERAYDIILNFLREEIAKNPKAFEDNKNNKD